MELSTRAQRLAARRGRELAKARRTLAKAGKDRKKEQKALVGTMLPCTRGTITAAEACFFAWLLVLALQAKLLEAGEKPAAEQFKPEEEWEELLRGLERGVAEAETAVAEAEAAAPLAERAEQAVRADRGVRRGPWALRTEGKHLKVVPGNAGAAFVVLPIPSPDAEYAVRRGLVDGGRVQTPFGGVAADPGIVAFEHGISTEHRSQTPAVGAVDVAAARSRGFSPNSTLERQQFQELQGAGSEDEQREEGGGGGGGGGG